MLRADQIARLKSFQIARRLSLPLLNAAIGGSEHFTWQVLQRAMQGKPVWWMNHDFIVSWIESHLPHPKDGKTAASGEQ